MTDKREGVDRAVNPDKRGAKENERREDAGERQRVVWQIGKKIVVYPPKK